MSRASVAPGALQVGSFGLQWSIEFATQRGDVPTIEVDVSGLTSVAAVRVDTTTQGQSLDTTYTIPFSADAAGNMWIVSLSSSNERGESDSSIDWDSSDVAGTLAAGGLGAVPLGRIVGASPAAPQLDSVQAYSGSQVKVAWTPTQANGDVVTTHKVEWHADDAVMYSQQWVNLTVDASSPFGPSGSFALSLDGRKTRQIAHDAPAASVKDALNSLTNVGDTTVNKVTDGANVSWLVEFNGIFGPVSTMVVDDGALSGHQDIAVSSLQDGQWPHLYGRYDLAERHTSLDVQPCSSFVDGEFTGICATGQEHRQSLLLQASGNVSGTFALWFGGEVVSLSLIHI